MWARLANICSVGTKQFFICFDFKNGNSVLFFVICCDVVMKTNFIKCINQNADASPSHVGERR